MNEPPRSFPSPIPRTQPTPWIRTPGEEDPLRSPERSRSAPETRRSAQLNRSSLGTGVGTLLSRVSGLVRLVVLAACLGGGNLANVFNLANNTPNMVHDLVLGGILSATFIPVFIERMAGRSRAEAEESISAVVTISVIGLVGASALLAIFAPAVVDAYMSGAKAATPEAHAIAVELLRWFAPQVLCYGAVSLISAVLATRDRFAVVGFVPILNNLVNIAVFVAFAVLSRHLDVGRTLSPALIHHDSGLILLLGLGTTVGVVVQALALLPSLARTGVRLRFVWRPHDPAVRTIVSLSGWTFGFVVANQVAVFVILALEYHLGGGSVTAYTYAYQFFVFPFAVVAVSVINVASPDLARSWAAGAPNEVGERFGIATRQVMALILPAAVGYLLLARPAMVLVIDHGAETHANVDLTASVLALFALGLPGFSVFLLATRVFQAMQDTRTAFVCYAIENGTNILLAFVLYHRLGVRGLALSYSIAYTLAAIIALVVLRSRLGRIGGHILLVGFFRAAVLSLLMAFAIAFAAAIIGESGGLFGWLKLIVTVVIGGAVYLGGAGAAGTFSVWYGGRRQRPIGGLHRKGGRGRYSGGY